MGKATVTLESNITKENSHGPPTPALDDDIIKVASAALHHNYKHIASILYY